MSPRIRLVLKAVFWVAVAIVLVILPFQIAPTDVNALVTIMYLSIVVLGLNLLTGFTGMISVGHGAFMGVGAYTTAILVANHGFPWFGALACAVVASFLVGVLIGLPALRIRGLQLALATIGLAVLFPQIVKRFSDITGGDNGLRVPETFDAPDWSSLENDQWLYFVVLAFTAASFVLARNLIKSRVGRGMVAIRDNPTAAEAAGVNVSLYKVMVFGISAGLAGLGGALFVFRFGFVNASSFQLTLSIDLLVTAVVGGIATIVGPIVGEGGSHYFNDWIGGQSFDLLQPVFYGAGLILLMRFLPEGVVGGLKRLGGTILRRRTQVSDEPPEAPPDSPSSDPPGEPDGGEPVLVGGGSPQDPPG